MYPYVTQDIRAELGLVLKLNVGALSGIPAFVQERGTRMANGVQPKLAAIAAMLPHRPCGKFALFIAVTQTPSSFRQNNNDNDNNCISRVVFINSIVFIKCPCI